MLKDAGCKRKEWYWDEEKYQVSWISTPGAKLLAYGICIDQDYNKYAEPEAGKTVIYSTIEKQNVRSVNDKEGTMSVDFTLVIRWKDPNLHTHLSEDEKKNSGIALTPAAIKEIWTPDVYVFDRKSFQTSDEWISLKSAKILATTEFANLKETQYTLQNKRITTVEIRYELKSTVYCNFDFSEYPMDDQMCEFSLGSGSNSSHFQLHDPSNKYHIEKSYKAAGFQLLISFLEKMNHAGGNTIGISVKMNRDLTSFIMTYYIPCMSIVVSCALGFVIPDYPEGRISLMVTLFLTLMTLFINQMVRRICRQYLVTN